MDKIKILRKKIDRLDDEILSLLNKRAGLGIEIGRQKGTNKESPSNFHVPDREARIYERLCKLNLGPLPTEAIKAVYREIFSATLALERPLTIVYLGPEATFTQEAALKQFGSSASYIPAKSIDAIFTEVERGRADYGVVPIENSNEGIVSHTLDLFVESPLIISGEIILKITQNLLSCGQSLTEIKKVYSHPQPFAQCHTWLSNHLPDSLREEVLSTAQAAKLASEEPHTAAIASESAAKIYHLNILVKNINDHINNYTRFLVIGKTKAKPSGKDRTSLLLSIKDKPGALYSILSPFARTKINLTKIESRPVKKKAWQYVFFIDLDGHEDDKKIRLLLGKLGQQTDFMKILGSYPRSVG